MPPSSFHEHHAQSAVATAMRRLPLLSVPQMQEDAKGGLFVRGLTLRLATTEEEALNHFFEGDMNRAVAGHTMNTQSSRSHCIFSIYIEGKSRVESNDRIVTSKLHLVDLAGCERVKKTKSDGLLLRESSYINKSLSFLEMVSNDPDRAWRKLRAWHSGSAGKGCSGLVPSSTTH